MYLCYGIHHLFNVVTNTQDTPHAVLIRAIEPTEGIPVMLERRRMEQVKPALTSGPGAMSMALGIHTRHTGLSLAGAQMYIEDGIKVAKKDIIAATRVGVGYAQDDAYLPYRFYIKGSPWVSKGKGL